MRTPGTLSTLYPWPLVLELTDAAARHDTDRIDAVTDRLVRMGLCRPRTDCSRFAPVAPADATTPVVLAAEPQEATA